MIRILQISDIHFLSCEEEDDQYSQLRQRLLDDIDNLVDTRGNIDVILVCGDVANTGQKEEYDKARSFFIELAKHCHCSLDCVFMVPGNHDVNRNNYKTAREVLRKALFDEKTNDDVLKNWRIKEPQALILAHAPFEDYREMALIFNSNDEVSQAIIAGELDFSKKKFYWQKNIGIEGGFNVNVFGMSTALISGSGDFVPEKGTGQKMFIPKCSYSIVTHKDEINILMLHHPMSHVMKGKDIEKKLDARFQVQLFGHTHKQSSDAKEVIKIYSGALQPEEVEGDEYVPIYNLMELHVDNGENYDKRLVVELYSRQGSDTGFVAYKNEKETLSVSIKEDNNWASTVKPTVKEEIEGKLETISELTRTINEINYTFMNMSGAKYIINKMYKGFYDPKFSDRTNRLRFLQRVKADNRYEELDKLIAK